MTRTDTGAVDLVCGPDGPLPEGRQRYRLLGRLGAGGQADVYRGVRLSGGVSSSPVTVKVFRSDPSRPLLNQLRSWDKGDAVLMDLNSRGVEGICLRVDGFYGAPPVGPQTTTMLGGDVQIPFQVLDFLPGRTLLEHVAAGANGSEPLRLGGAAVLGSLARTLAVLHRPAEPDESPVLHMDLKPSNVIVLPSGDVRLIDFTTARYQDPSHITTIAYTPESAGPEAHTGRVSSSYDVHGFGAVAYYLVTGWLPRSDRYTPSHPGVVTAPSSLRRHPLLDQHPALAGHLLAPLADSPGDRPRTDELTGWVATLAALAGRLQPGSTYVDWADPTATRAFAPVSPAPPAGGTRVQAAGGTRVQPVSPPLPPVRIASGIASVRPPWPAAGLDPPPVGPWHAPGREAYPQGAGPTAGPGGYGAPPAPYRRRRGRGRGWTTFGLSVAGSCWLLWGATVAVRPRPDTGELFTALALVVGAAVGVYWLTRLAGHLLRSTLDRGPRKGTFVPHLVTTLFLLLAASGFFTRAKDNFGAVGDWFTGLWPF